MAPTDSILNGVAAVTAVTIAGVAARLQTFTYPCVNCGCVAVRHALPVLATCINQFSGDSLVFLFGGAHSERPRKTIIRITR